MAFRLEQILGWRSLVTVFFVRYENVGPFSFPLKALALSRVKYLDIPVVFTAMRNNGVVNKK